MTHVRPAVRILLAELGQSASANPSVAMATAARSLRDAGAEVVHSGVLGSVRAVIRIAEQEDPAALVLGVVAENSEAGDTTAIALWNPDAVAEVVAALPQVPLFGLGERARTIGVTTLPAELEDLVESLAHAAGTSRTLRTLRTLRT